MSNKLLCVNGIPARGLHSGSIYTELSRWHCCGIKPWPLVSVAESTGRTKPCVCRKCKKLTPRAPNGWYDSRRFVPWNPPPIFDQLETNKEAELTK